jgi:hypothetical protein
MNDELETIYVSEIAEWSEQDSALINDLGWQAEETGFGNFVVRDKQGNVIADGVHFSCPVGVKKPWQT